MVSSKFLIMESRLKDLSQLQSYIEGIDKEVTMILQSLQWDRKHLLQGSTMVACKYDLNHRVPSDRLRTHERVCLLKSLGYSEEDAMLPDPADPEADTLVTLSLGDIKQIISEASKSDPLFRKVFENVCYMALHINFYILLLQGTGCCESAPLTLDRLQATYTPDERRAIHDAVVNAVPSCHNLADLALPSAGGDKKQSREKSRVEILAELRDTKRRRAKYRGAAKTRNYSDVLRDVITTQMEYYSDSQVRALSADSQVSNQQSQHHSKYGNHENKHMDSHEGSKVKYSSHDTELYREAKEKRNNTKKRQEHRDHSPLKAKETPSRSKSRYDDEYESKSERYHSHHGTKNYSDNKYKKQRISSGSQVKSNRNEKYENSRERSRSYVTHKHNEGSSRDRKGHRDAYDHEVNRYDKEKQKEYTKGKNEEKHKRYYDTNKLEVGSEVYSYDERRKRKRDC